MKCIEIRENLDVLLDAESDFLPQDEIKMHLKNCIHCRIELANLQTVSRKARQILPVATPVFLDNKIFNAFENFHTEKRAEIKDKKIGWFGIPRFALATAFILLAVFSGIAFQIGRISVKKAQTSKPESAANDQKSLDERLPEIKIVEVPIIKEKIVEVPIVKEKIVTRTVYKYRSDKSLSNPRESSLSTNSDENFAQKNEYSTKANLKGFQSVSELKPQIIKSGEPDEK